MSDDDNDQLTPTERDELRDMGFSPEFLTVAGVDPDTVGETRNNARRGARRFLDGQLPVTDNEGFETAVESLGHYFSALATGDVGRAFLRADVPNTRLLLHAFGREYLIERVADDDGRSTESAAQIVDERIESFAADLAE